jgi:hypothetical protein
MATASTGEVITEVSTPNLDDWGWDKYWNANDWMEWYKVMKAKKGKTYADSTFITWWNKQTMGASPLDAVTFNSAFRAFLKKENLYDSVANLLDKPLGAINDIVSSGSNVVSNTGKGAEGLSKALKFVLPAVVVVLGIGISFWAYKKFVK